MNRDEASNSAAPLERELRRTLDEMAREPAPERLVARVAEIPNEEPVRGPIWPRLRLSPPHLGPTFAALAGALAIALAALVLRPAGHAPGGPGSSPIATASPSSAAAPIGFEVVSVTFVSADQGFVLGSVPCGSTLCAAIERTADGGRTWVPAQAPKAAVVSGSGTESRPIFGISRLRFATPSDGWAFGPDLWATHDGGASWTKVSAPDMPSGSTMVALEAARGSVHVAFYDGTQDFRIATSPVGSDAWTVSPIRIAVGAGPVPTIQLVLSGDAGWLLENDRTVVGGARLVGGTWRTWQPACADVMGPAAIAASSPIDLVASCDVGLWGSPQGNHLFVSSDGGATFAETGGTVPVTPGGGVATPDTSTIVVSGSDSGGSVLVGSFDGGQTWATVLRAGSVGLNELGFTTSTQGVVVTTSASGSGRLLVSRDGGHTWSAVEF